MDDSGPSGSGKSPLNRCISGVKGHDDATCAFVVKVDCMRGTLNRRHRKSEASLVHPRLRH